MKNVVSEKAVSICVIIQQDWKVKRKLQLHNIKVSSTTVWRYVTNKGWKALKRKKAVHTSCRHGIRRICKLYTKGRPAGKLTWCEPPSNHLDYCWWDKTQPYFSALATFLPKSFTRAFSSNSCVAVRRLSQIYKSVLEIVWDEVFIVDYFTMIHTFTFLIPQPLFNIPPSWIFNKLKVRGGLDAWWRSRE